MSPVCLRKERMFNRNRPIRLGALLSMCLTASAAVGTTVEVEGFENGGASLARWAWAVAPSVLQPGGNPGMYARQFGLTSFLPTATTVDPSLFTGNYRENRVLSVGIDLILTAGSMPAVPLTVRVSTDNGTPDSSDDWGAQFVGSANVPSAPSGWQSYSFLIPSQEVSLPAGWTFFANSGAPTPSWLALMQDVDVVRFHYGVPGTIWAGGNVDYGMDNARIEFGDPPIPTTSQWGATAMALVLLIGGTLAVARSGRKALTALPR